jgi:hypothetical protein
MIAAWIAVGDTYIKEAHRSMRSFVKHNPAVSTVLLASSNNSCPEFDHTITVEYDYSIPMYYNFVRAYQILPSLGERVIFLDSDTYTCGPLDDVWEALDYFDFVGCHSPGRHASPNHSVRVTAFPEINGGVWALRGNNVACALLAEWLKQCDDHEWMRNNEQIPLREALLNWNGRLGVLSEEYNFRFRLGGRVRGFVYILHGRSDNYLALSKKVNQNPCQFRSWRKGELQ